MEELRREWLTRLTGDEQGDVQRAAKTVGGPARAMRAEAAKDAAELAIDHCFDRKSVVPERQLLAEALKRSIGQASRRTAEKAVRMQNLIVAEWDGRPCVTTPDVLAEEQRMIDFARQGRGACQRLGDSSHAIARDWLNDGQRAAVTHILTSHDRVTLLRGAAGVGKTSMMQEAVEGIQSCGMRVFVFAPSAEASRNVLRQEGFKDAETVARLLVDEKLQQQVKGQVVWIDEAGLLGVKTMTQVFDLAERLDARVVLSGDCRQHGSVERGAALRLLEEEAGLVPAEIRDIQRQKGAYKKAVAALSEGRTEDGFRQLDELCWIKQVSEADRYKLLATDYVAAAAEGKSCLVVSPTHQEGESISDEIRNELHRTGKLGAEQRPFRVLENANLTAAERCDAVNYQPSDVLVFHQNGKGFTKGQRVVVGESPLPLREAAKFQAYHANMLPISPGDAIRITRNGKTADGQHRLNNGAMFTVKKFSRVGDIVLSNGWTLEKDFGHFTYGYVVTSHASQGKTVDRVPIGQSSQSFPASSQEQFYVSCSRGRQQATVYTDDKSALLDAVRHSDDRMTATEFLSGRERRERGLAVQRMETERSSEPERAERTREGVTYER